jgi:hypothetical protein
MLWRDFWALMALFGTLPEALTGYADYATRVRARLLPGVW